MLARLCRLALVALLAAGAAVPASAQAPETAIERVAEGDALLGEGLFGEARDRYRAALAAQPDLLAAHIGLGRVAMAQEDWAAAAERFDLVLARAPESIEALYYRGIVHREEAKFNALLGIPNWRQAAERFDDVLARDSLYRDVLYQYALLRRYGRDYLAAIRLGHEQLRLKPELDEPRRGLFGFYRYFIHNVAPDSALAVLEADPSDYADFARAELFRRQGQLDRAEDLLTSLRRRTSLPKQPILLALARIEYARGDALKGQFLVEEAIRTVESPTEAALVFEDFKLVLNDGELEQYRSLARPEAYRAFFTGLWAARDPVPARRENVRLTEHYRRLAVAERDYAFDGFRFWNNGPDKMNEITLPAVYDLNDQFNDRGLIYVRHGEPNDRITTVGGGEMDFFFTSNSTVARPDWLPKDQSFEASWTPNESWRYLDPLMDFHFVIDAGGGVDNWRLAPALMNYQMLQDREQWGGVYARLASTARVSKNQMQRAADGFDNAEIDAALEDPGQSGLVEQEVVQGTPGQTVRATRPDYRPSRLTGPGRSVNAPTFDLMMYRDQMVERSQVAIDLGLSTDAHSWSDEVEPLELPHLLTAFRDAEGRTNLEIHYAVPIGLLTERLGPDEHVINVEVGCALFGPEWERVADDVATRRMPPVPDREAAVIDYCRLAAPADSYHVAFHGAPAKTRHLGGYKYDLALPDYSASRLDMSDVLPATAIRPANGPSRFNRGELYIQANPFARFTVGQPLFLYYEVYNLTYGSDDLTRYSVEYELAPDRSDEGTAGRVRGLFRRSDQPALSVRSEREGSEIAPREYTELDVSRVDPGRYVLTVRVRDELTGAQTERALPIELTK